MVREIREGPCVHERFEMELGSRLRNIEVWRVEEDEDKQSPREMHNDVYDTAVMDRLCWQWWGCLS